MKRRPDDSPLKGRPARFVSEYGIDGNATQAAIRAGYSPATARTTGLRLMRNDAVAVAIAQRAERIADRLEITQERIMNELAKIAFADPRKVMRWGPGMRSITNAEGVVIGWTDGVAVIPWDEMDEESAAAIAEIAETRDGIKMKLHDKVGALHKLGLHLGMFQAKTVGTADNPFHAFIQSMQGSSLPIGHQQPGPQATVAPAVPSATPIASPSSAAPAPRRGSPLLGGAK